jgi:histidinol-phosphate/aromatic aminotransferase/cobyric acid decarboxylase-like protein
LLALAERFGRIAFLVDEAFLGVSENHAEASVEHPPNVVRIRSLTKELAIPGLRLGYLVGAREAVERLRAVEPPWSVNQAAQAAGLAALGVVATVRERWLEARRALTFELETAGFVVVPSLAPYVLVRVRDARATTQRCLERGVLVRDGSSFGLPDFVRVGARPAVDRARLLEALREAASR